MANLLEERMQQSFIDHVDENLLMDCMRCGFCLPACPTYLITGQDEVHSPRGRIALMKAVRDGEVKWDGSVEEAFDVCLGCRACEPACPAGVQYGTLLEETRYAVEQAKPIGLSEKLTRKVAFDGLFANQQIMQGTVKLIQFYQTTGIQKVARKIGFMELFPKTLRDMEKVLPKITSKKQSSSPSNPKIKVAFFTGCLMDTMFQQTNQRTIELLESLGAEVVVPKGQACCGALHGHSGEIPKAKRNALQNIEAFQHTDYSYIVQNAGGCGAFLSEYGKLLATDEAKRFSEKLIDISSLLVQLGLTDKMARHQVPVEGIVTYQDSCHLRNVNKVWIEPRALLQASPGWEFKEMPNASGCCGSAGIYNILQPEIASQLLEQKMKGVRTVRPARIVTTNPGCLLQMKVGIEREGLSDEMEAVHIVDFVYESIFQTIKGV